MRWIRLEPRLAIYLRDDLTCAWCGQSARDGVELTLDHCKPRNKGGDNKPSKQNSSQKERWPNNTEAHSVQHRVEPSTPSRHASCSC